MQIKSKLPWFACVAISLVTVWLFFKLIDQSVTLDHQKQYANVILKQRNLLAHMLNSTIVKAPESEVRELIKQFPGDPSFQKGSDEIVAEQVSFFFKDGQLVRVDVGNDTAH